MLKDIEFLFKIEKCPKLYIGDEGDLSDIIYYGMGYGICLSELGMAKDWGSKFDAFVHDWYQDTDQLSISFWNRIQQHSNGKEDAIKQFYQILHCFCDENKSLVSESI